MAVEIKLELKDEEAAVLDGFAEEFDMSREAVFRQALRLYQLVNRRIAEGETFGFSGDAERARAFAGPLAGGA